MGRSDLNRTQPERDKRLKESNRKKGRKQVTVWVPAARAEELKEIAAKWRNEVVTKNQNAMER